MVKIGKYSDVQTFTHTECHRGAQLC